MNLEHVAVEAILRCIRYRQCGIMILVVLQNTYEYLTNTPEWEKALWASHTGRRLKRMLPSNTKYVVTNATKEIGDGPDSVCEPDKEHLLSTIDAVHPTKILACGKVAQAVLKELNVNFFAAPHPAWRRLTNRQCDIIREELNVLR